MPAVSDHAAVSATTSRRYSGRGYFERARSYRLSTSSDPRAGRPLPRIQWTDRKGHRTTGPQPIARMLRIAGDAYTHLGSMDVPPPTRAALAVTCTSVHVVDELRYEFSCTTDAGADVRFRAQAPRLLSSSSSSMAVMVMAMMATKATMMLS